MRHFIPALTNILASTPTSGAKKGFHHSMTTASAANSFTALKHRIQVMGFSGLRIARAPASSFSWLVSKIELPRAEFAVQRVDVVSDAAAQRVSRPDYRKPHRSLSPRLSARSPASLVSTIE
jgi:hypothetical protein